MTMRTRSKRCVRQRPLPQSWRRARLVRRYTIILPDWRAITPRGIHRAGGRRTSSGAWQRKLKPPPYLTSVRWSRITKRGREQRRNKPPDKWCSQILKSGSDKTEDLYLVHRVPVRTKRTAARAPRRHASAIYHETMHMAVQPFCLRDKLEVIKTIN